MAIRPAVLLLLALAVLPSPAWAGLNAGAHSQLSWSATSGVETAPMASDNHLYLRFFPPTGGTLSFKGVHLYIFWDPPNQGSFGVMGFSFPTATDCTYLNRGTATIQQEIFGTNQLLVEWTNDVVLTGCTSGAAIDIEITADASVPGACFEWGQSDLIDANGAHDAAPPGPGTWTCVLLGEGGFANCPCFTPVGPSSWGGIKALYK